MGRRLRVEFHDAVHHVTARGNARESIFGDPNDCLAFLHQVGRAIERYGWLCHGYCLMPNHYHLLLETPEPNLARGMRDLNCGYAQRYNDRYLRTGHVFGGRYRSVLVERDQHLLAANRYIVLNPCRARLCGWPAEWMWSSYATSAGARGVEPFELSDFILGLFDEPGRTESSSYARFVAAGLEEGRRDRPRAAMPRDPVPGWWRARPGASAISYMRT